MDKWVLGVFLVLVSLTIISAETRTFYLRPIENGDKVFGKVYTYEWRFTENSDCTNVIFTYATTIQTDTKTGDAVVDIPIPSQSNLSDVRYVCEYRDGNLRATFLENDLFLSSLYVQNVSVKNNITSSWFLGKFNWTENSSFLTFDGSTLSFNPTGLGGNTTNEIFGVVDNNTFLKKGEVKNDTWGGNQTNYLNSSIIFSYGWYNLSSFNINDYLNSTNFQNNLTNINNNILINGTLQWHDQDLNTTSYVTFTNISVQNLTNVLFLCNSSGVCFTLSDLNKSSSSGGGNTTSEIWAVIDNSTFIKFETDPNWAGNYSIFNNSWSSITNSSYIIIGTKLGNTTNEIFGVVDNGTFIKSQSNDYNLTTINSTSLEDQSGFLGIKWTWFTYSTNNVIGNFSFTNFYGLITGNRTVIESEIAGNLTTAKTYTDTNVNGNRTSIESEISGNLTISKTYTDNNIASNRTAINENILGNDTVGQNTTFTGTNQSEYVNRTYLGLYNYFNSSTWNNAWNSSGGSDTWGGNQSAYLNITRAVSYGWFNLSNFNIQHYLNISMANANFTRIDSNLTSAFGNITNINTNISNINLNLSRIDGNQKGNQTTNGSYASLIYNNTGSVNLSGSINSNGGSTLANYSYPVGIAAMFGTSLIYNNATGLVLRG